MLVTLVVDSLNAVCENYFSSYCFITPISLSLPVQYVNMKTFQLDNSGTLLTAPSGYYSSARDYIEMLNQLLHGVTFGINLSNNTIIDVDEYVSLKLPPELSNCLGFDNVLFEYGTYTSKNCFTFCVNFIFVKCNIVRDAFMNILMSTSHNETVYSNVPSLPIISDDPYMRFEFLDENFLPVDFLGGKIKLCFELLKEPKDRYMQTMAQFGVIQHKPLQEEKPKIRVARKTVKRKTLPKKKQKKTVKKSVF